MTSLCKTEFLLVRPLLLALPCFSLLLFFASADTAQAALVPVRFKEGLVRGFLKLSDSDGKRIASGDFLQSPEGDGIKSRTLLHFTDGSLHDETVVFTQQRNLVMKSYRLVQKGRAFKDDLEISLQRAGGRYRVELKGKEGRQKVLEGKLELPDDVYNGMIPVLMKNLAKGARGSVHLVAFTPSPRVVELELVPSGEDSFSIGDLEQKAAHYLLKAKLGLLRLPAALLGRLPPDNHIWTVLGEAPGFVKFEGPLAPGGPVWRIELTSPAWPK